MYMILLSQRCSEVHVFIIPGTNARGCYKNDTERNGKRKTCRVLALSLPEVINLNQFTLFIIVMRIML